MDSLYLCSEAKHFPSLFQTRTYLYSSVSISQSGRLVVNMDSTLPRRYSELPVSHVATSIIWTAFGHDLKCSLLNDSLTTVAPFASRRVAAHGAPQAIAHRGYKARFPENTLAAFRGAVDVGAHAIETDLHLSKDGVVVLSHVREPERTDPCLILDHSLLCLSHRPGCYAETLLWRPVADCRS